ncbi:ABC transporter permease [Candidatus Curtissbacteria bacterium]|nr:ABC transporter permease [Candidatus Curtissbacteria bacterium]
MTLTGNLSELVKFRELLLAFTDKEIKIRYKQTLLGFLWAILQPAALTLIFSIVFGVFLKVSFSTIPYPVFAYSALLPWSFLSSALSFGSLSVVNNSSLVTKVYFPREIMPLSSIAAAFFDFIVAGLIFILMFFIFKVPIGANIAYLLIIIPSLLALTIGISLILAAINVLYRDVRFVLPIFLQVFMYLTPIIYSVEQIPQKYRVYVLLNPAAGLVESFRDVTVLNRSPQMVPLAYSIAMSFVILILGYAYFKKKEKVFADVI